MERDWKRPLSISGFLLVMKYKFPLIDYLFKEYLFILPQKYLINISKILL